MITCSLPSAPARGNTSTITPIATQGPALAAARRAMNCIQSVLLLFYGFTTFRSQSMSQYNSLDLMARPFTTGLIPSRAVYQRVHQPALHPFQPTDSSLFEVPAFHRDSRCCKLWSDSYECLKLATQYLVIFPRNGVFRGPTLARTRTAYYP